MSVSNRSQASWGDASSEDKPESVGCDEDDQESPMITISREELTKKMMQMTSQTMEKAAAEILRAKKEKEEVINEARNLVEILRYQLHEVRTVQKYYLNIMYIINKPNL